MKNHWLDVERARISSEIDFLISDIWAKDGTFGEFWTQLTQEQIDLLTSMKLHDGAMDGEDFTLKLRR